MRAAAKYLVPAVVLASLACIAPADAEVTLSFGVYASDKPTAMVRQFRPVLRIIESRLAMKLGEPVTIRLQVAKTYEKGIMDLVERKVDFARFGPASYIEAKEADSEISIIAVEGNEGTKSFNGVICVAESSAIRSLQDLRGKSFAFGDRRSTIGRYLSQLYLFRGGVRSTDLKHFDYLDRHDKVGHAVASGRFDAGALKESTYVRLLEAGVPLRVIGSFPNVTKPWIARGGLDERYRRVLQEVILQINDEEALRALAKDGFLEGDDSDYASVREAIRNNHLFFAGLQAAQDTN